MGEPLDIQRTLRLNVERCYKCGTYWAHEAWGRATCPRCAATRIDAAEAREVAAQKSARALRGVIARMKRKAKRREPKP